MHGRPPIAEYPQGCECEVLPTAIRGIAVTHHWRCITRTPQLFNSGVTWFADKTRCVASIIDTICGPPCDIEIAFICCDLLRTISFERLKCSASQKFVQLPDKQLGLQYMLL